MSADNESLQDPSPLTASTFHSFNFLPLEIRIAIWTEALPGPRIVSVSVEKLKGGVCSRVWSNKANDHAGNEAFFDSSQVTSALHDAATTTADSQPGVGSGPKPCFALRTYEPIPSMLLVCRESHEIAASVYTRAFGTLGTPANIWFSFQNDTLYFPDEVHENFITGIHLPDVLGPDAVYVSKIAIGDFHLDHHLDFPNYDPTWACKFIDFFGGVTDITFAVQEHKASDVKNLSYLSAMDLQAAEAHYSSAYNPDEDTNWDIFHERCVRRLKAQGLFMMYEIRAQIQYEEDHPDEYPEQIQWPTPSIHRVVITTEERKASLAELEAEYDSQRCRFTTALVLISSLGRMAIEVGQRTRIKHVQKVFRRTYGLSADAHITVRYSGMFPGTEERVLSLPNIGPHDVVEVEVLDE